MRQWLLLTVVVGLQAAVVRAEGPDGGVSLQGTWRLDERKATVRFTEADGGWNGVIDTSPRTAEVGFVLFRALQPTTATELRGTLAMPENGSTHEVVLTLDGRTAKAVAGKWIFSKTLLLERAP